MRLEPSGNCSESKKNIRITARDGCHQCATGFKNSRIFSKIVLQAFAVVTVVNAMTSENIIKAIAVEGNAAISA